MIRIAICDDEIEAVAQHENVVKNCLHSCGIGYEIATYTQSSNLLFDITDDSFFYNLILLDIEMPGMTGMELSEKIKPHLPNIRIIFITSHIEYAIDAFELFIFRYVPTSDLTNRLVSAVVDAAKLIELPIVFLWCTAVLLSIFFVQDIVFFALIVLASLFLSVLRLLIIGAYRFYRPVSAKHLIKHS